MLYRNATFETYVPDGADPSLVLPTGSCEVRIDGGDIVVGGEFDGEKWMYRGRKRVPDTIGLNAGIPESRERRPSIDSRAQAFWRAGGTSGSRPTGSN